jgi:hypothetical protein
MALSNESRVRVLGSFGLVGARGDAVARRRVAERVEIGVGEGEDALYLGVGEVVD